MRRLLVVVVVFALWLVGCASDDSQSETTTSLTASEQTTEPTSSPVTSTEPESTTTSTAPATTTTTERATTSTAPTTTTMPPPPELIPGPPVGSAWMVVGVESSDILNVRDGPGIAYRVVGTLEPTAKAVVASSAAFLVGRSIWWEVATPSVDGWVNSLYLAAGGATEDVTSSIIGQLGMVPSAPTLPDLALLVIEARAPDGARIVVVADATVSNDIGEMAVDFFPTEWDDSVRGERLRIFGQLDGTTGPFSLYSVEATALCWRGADAAGLCV